MQLGGLSKKDMDRMVHEVFSLPTPDQQNQKAQNELDKVTKELEKVKKKAARGIGAQQQASSVGSATSDTMSGLGAHPVDPIPQKPACFSLSFDSLGRSSAAASKPAAVVNTVSQLDKLIPELVIKQGKLLAESGSLDGLQAWLAENISLRDAHVAGITKAALSGHHAHILRWIHSQDPQILSIKMGLSEFDYEPIVDRCRCGDSEMVSLLLELGVELADVGRPGRRLDWYKQYLRDDAVDSQLTALLPSELHARTNLEVRQEKERLEAAKRAEEQRLLDDETYVLDETTKFEGAHPNPHETRADCACVRARVRACAGMQRDFQRFNWCFPGRCKLYRLEKGENGTDEYKDVGSGILHLHWNAETGRQRVGSHSRKTRAHTPVCVCVRTHRCECAYGCACGACVRGCVRACVRVRVR
jgi:hypothetical protein